jgi:competence protein ComEA
MKRFLKQYFTFSRTEQRGIFVLTLIILALISVNILIPRLHLSKQTNDQALITEIEQFEQQLKNEQSGKEEFDFYQPDKSVAKNTLNPTPFNPNKITEDEWIAMGLNPKKAKIIINYLTKGGRFRKREDLRKIYSITSEEYSVLEPFIIIPATDTVKSFSTQWKKLEAKVFNIELNSSDTLDLQELRGIGPGFARRIVKYRDMLGGFYKKDQLLEVYGLDSITYKKMLPDITIDPSKIKKININAADVKDLKKHPYLDYYIAKAIVTFRSQNGNFKSVEDLRRVNLIYDDIFLKIKPYISLN